MTTSCSLTFRDFFHSYIFAKPEACMHLSESKQKIVKFAKGLFKIFTLGIVPALCKRKWGKIEDCQLRVKNLAEKLKKCNYFGCEKVEVTAKSIRESKDKSCDRILNGLFLGSSKGFVEATTLTFKVKKENCQLVLTTFNNKHDFTSIITMCPLSAIEGDYTELKLGELPGNFSDRKVAWLQPGKDLADNSEAAYELVYNATFVNKEDNLMSEGLIGQEVANLEQKTLLKKEEIEKINIQDWFEPTFLEMDKAVLGDINVLVHCQAGASRSATLVAAYLINRFNLSSKDALNYLQHRRACVAPKFEEFLANYAEQLKQINPS